MDILCRAEAQNSDALANIFSEMGFLFLMLPTFLHLVKEDRNKSLANNRLQGLLRVGD